MLYLRSSINMYFILYFIFYQLHKSIFQQNKLYPNFSKVFVPRASRGAAEHPAEHAGEVPRPPLPRGHQLGQLPRRPAQGLCRAGM